MFFDRNIFRGYGLKIILHQIFFSPNIFESEKFFLYQFFLAQMRSDVGLLLF